MALIHCPECSKEISNKAAACPYCGCPASCFPNGEQEAQTVSEPQIKEKPIKDGETMQVNVANRTLNYGDAIIQYSKLQKLFLSKGAQVRKNFIEYYANNIHSFNDIVNKLPNTIEQVESDAYKFVVEVFMKYGIDYITTSKVEEEAEEYVDFEDILAPYLVEWDNIENARLEMERRRAIERSSRSSWSGGGFGVKGAIKGAVTAGMMNAATGVFRGIGDSITDSSDRGKINELKRRVFEDPFTMQSITQDLYDDIVSLSDYVYDVLIDNECIPEWDYEIDNLDGRLENYCEMYKKDSSKKSDLINAVVDCIAEYPFDISYYITLYDLDAIPYKKIKEIVALWGLEEELQFELKPVRKALKARIQKMPEDTSDEIAKKISEYEAVQKKDSDINVSDELSRLNEKKNFFTEGENIVENVEKGKTSAGRISISEIDAALEKKDFKKVWDEAEAGNGYAEWKLENYYSSLIDKDMDDGLYSSIQAKLKDVKEKVNEGYKFAEYLCTYFDYRYYGINRRNPSREESMAKKIKEFADGGCLSAIDVVGWWYQHGYHDLPSSPSKAVECYKTAVNQNHVLALCHLGLCYRDGKGVPVDRATAEKLLQKSSQWGSAFATRELGKLRSGSSGSDGCYITTAVCDWQGKADDCYELTQFRRFRDLWLINEPDGKELIEEYYSIAPLIVEKIESNKDRADIYSLIFDGYLSQCLQKIESKDYQGCKQKYVEMVNGLKEKFLL